MESERCLATSLTRKKSRARHSEALENPVDCRHIARSRQREIRYTSLSKLQDIQLPVKELKGDQNLAKSFFYELSKFSINLNILVRSGLDSITRAEETQITYSAISGYLRKQG